ncbi:DUF4416 family protein, partial [Candidatus Dependentiae bacterium]|nr:DUF4416 family protein [Candidatus Dependentiae bacterium]
ILPQKVKLIAGLLYNESVDSSEVLKILSDLFGKIDFSTAPYLFKYSDYYDKEMGQTKFRQFISFENLVEMDILPDIKIKTNEIECNFSTMDKRNINIDPGYIELGKLVLASTKNYTHRIYIGKGIFAEPTLQYFKKTYTSWPFSYPDYSDEFAVSFFNKVREKYKTQL